VPIDKWTIGETASFPLQITDANGVAVDPQTIRLLIKPPGAAILTIDNPTRLSAGSFQHEQPLNKAGNWYYRWEVSAPLAAVAEGSITVQPSRFSA